ncbi:hypothetical protein ABZW11_39130 [Nonomuraea sp. NPDC004580]|uniref:hypothetical protein n=1 Tax=Nonomuraea sp. NPDC004580 TaxID=3154552 RepID=UPI0033BD92CA
MTEGGGVVLTTSVANVLGLPMLSAYAAAPDSEHGPASRPQARRAFVVPPRRWEAARTFA